MFGDREVFHLMHLQESTLFLLPKIWYSDFILHKSLLEFLTILEQSQLSFSRECVKKEMFLFENIFR